MEHSKYTQMVHAQEQAHLNAWNYITSTWHVSEWRPIPEGIRNTLGFPSSLGMYNGQLCTRVSALGAQEFIQRLNNRKIQ